MTDWNSLLYEDRPIFSDKLEEQLKQLETYEQTEYSREKREASKGAPHRPIFHFTRPDFSINDPNGLCFWEGRWHLFYQAQGARIHWGHAVSDDLITWTDLPFAIYPKYEQHCFSGGTCVDYENHRVIAAHYGFTGYWENGWRCGTMIAVSSDPLLLNWEKINGAKPVIPDADAPCWKAPDAPPVPNQKPYQVFDTCIWKENGVYYILEAGYTPDPETGRRFRQMHLLKCEDDDLLHWEYVKPFLENDRFKEVGDDGACPYFVKVGDKHVVFHFSHRGVPKWLIGDYDENTHTFTPFSAGRFTSGYGVTVAPCAYTLDDESAVVIFNHSEIGYCYPNWFGEMSLPRKITIGGAWKDELYEAPLCDYTSLHKDHIQKKNVVLSKKNKVSFPEMRSDAFEMVVNLKADKIPNTLEIEVLRSDDGEETTKITFMKEQGGMYAILPNTRDSVIMIDSTNGSQADSASVYPPEIAPVVKDASEDLKLHVFVDKSIVEVFVNDRKCILGRSYPEKGDSLNVTFNARGSDGEIESIDFWNMKSIWE